MRERVDDVVDAREEPRETGKPQRISPWLIILALLFTVAAAYEIYAGGNYLGLHTILSEEPIGHTLG